MNEWTFTITPRRVTASLETKNGYTLRMHGNYITLSDVHPSADYYTFHSDGLPEILSALQNLQRYNNGKA